MPSGGQNRLTQERVIEQFKEVHGDEFDYSKIDTSDYMWVNFFRNKDFADKLIEHREDIISKELLRNCANDVLTTDQMKILYGMLLDKSELWNIEGIFKD